MGAGMKPAEKMLAAVFGHTAESAAYAAAEQAKQAEADKAEARKLAEMANADEWTAAMGEWVPALYWGQPVAYCAAVNKTCAMHGGDLGVSTAHDAGELVIIE